MNPQTVRLRLSTRPSMVPELTLDFLRAMPLRVQAAVFDRAGVVSLSGVVSVTLLVKQSREDSSSASLMSKTVLASSFGNCTTDQWLSGAHQQLTFEFAAAEANLPIDGAVQASFWLVIKALLNTGQEVVLGSGFATCYESNAAAVGTPPANPEPGISGEQAAALIAVETAAREAADAALDQRLYALEAAGSEVTWETLEGKPATFPATAHTHSIADVSDLQTVLDGKAQILPAQAAQAESYIFSFVDGLPASGDYFLIPLYNGTEFLRLAVYFQIDGDPMVAPPPAEEALSVVYSLPNTASFVWGLVQDVLESQGYNFAQLSTMTARVTQPEPRFMDWGYEIQATGFCRIELDQPGLDELPERLAPIDGRDVTGVQAATAITAQTAAQASNSNLLGGSSLASILGQIGMVPLASAAAANISSVTFSTVFSNPNYDDFVVVVDNLAPATDNVALRVILRDGAVDLTGTYSWAFGFTPMTAGTAGSVVNQAAASGWVPLNTNMGNASNELSTLVLEIFPRRSGWVHAMWRGVYTNISTQLFAISGSGAYQAAVNATGIRFAFSSGNIATGRFTVFGRRRAP